MRAIPITQFLRPKGEQRSLVCDVSNDVARPPKVCPNFQHQTKPTTMKIYITIIAAIAFSCSAFASEELEKLSKYRGGVDAETYAFFMLKAGPPFNEAQVYESVEITSTVNTTFDYAKPTKKEHARYKEIYKKEFHKTMERITSGVTAEEMSLYLNHALTDDHIRRIIGIIPAK